MYEIILFLVLLAVGYVYGSIAERRHFTSIRRREKEYSKITAFSTRHLPNYDGPVTASLVVGNTVVSVDYFKRTAAGLRMLFGGRVTAYESLVERARREAILRMKEDAIRQGASQIFNVKLETASITKGAKEQVGCVEVYAYGTGVVVQPGR
ncbi:MAG: heavy metal-binding domain-containing protein [Gammaproteobacteria bacterium]|jgi:uncharacterized protein YbjQ (UPF0145 family)|nr:heavy metal-binding domain-containing protein [Gammaproteobacteria bacterium]